MFFRPVATPWHRWQPTGHSPRLADGDPAVSFHPFETNLLPYPTYVGMCKQTLTYSHTKENFKLELNVGDGMNKQHMCSSNRKLSNRGFYLKNKTPDTNLRPNSCGPVSSLEKLHLAKNFQHEVYFSEFLPNLGQSMSMLVSSLYTIFIYIPIQLHLQYADFSLVFQLFPLFLCWSSHIGKKHENTTWKVDPLKSLHVHNVLMFVQYP